MPSIIRFREVTDAYTTWSLMEPSYENEGPRVTRLCRLDGYVYASVPDGVLLPEQPEQIIVEEIEIDENLKARIKAASPQIRIINERVVEMIRERYSITDEIKMLRLAPSEETAAYNDYAEDCRAWGRSQKEALGM